jgi:ankyrin repeat protein
MKLLLRFGAKTEGSNALKHILDREDLEGLQLLQAAGANPNETNERAETALHWAIWRGRSVKAVAALVDHGADIHALRQDGRSAYAMAFVSGQAEVAAFLAERGAKTELSPLDQFVGACAHADPAELDRLLSTPPPNLPLSGNHRLLSDLAAEHRTSAVRGLLAAGMPVDARGEWGGTALHWACWKGYADLVELLIEHGAPLETEDHEFHAPPSGWMHHGTINCCQGDGNYARVARLLVAAGASMKDCATATGNPEVDAVLREHQLIA